MYVHLSGWAVLWVPRGWASLIGPWTTAGQQRVLWVYRNQSPSPAVFVQTGKLKLVILIPESSRIWIKCKKKRFEQCNKDFIYQIASMESVKRLQHLSRPTAISSHCSPVVRPLFITPTSFIDHWFNGEAMAWLHHSNCFVFWNKKECWCV